MKKDISLKVEIPQGVEVSVDEKVTVKAGDKEITRNFNLWKLKLRKDGNNVFVEAVKATKREIKLAGTIAGHLKNMIKGVTEGFTYKLQVASSHFPMRVEVDDVNKIVSVKNFLGGIIPRKAKILDGVEVKLEGDAINVSSIDKEAAGQTAANIEATTKVKDKDKRVFQDGIYLIEKPKQK